MVNERTHTRDHSKRYAADRKKKEKYRKTRNIVKRLLQEGNLKGNKKTKYGEQIPPRKSTNQKNDEIVQWEQKDHNGDIRDGLGI